MRSLLAALMFVVAAPAYAQVRVEVQLPSIVFPAPPHLVVVSPGVQVVEDYDDEVFFSDGFYWHRRGGSWFRTRTHTGGWEVVEPRLVPRAVFSVPEGKYRRWHHEAEERHDQGKHEEKGESHGKGKNKGGKH